MVVLRLFPSFPSWLVFTHHQLPTPIPSSHWKNEYFSCYFSWGFPPGLLKALQKISVQLYFHCLSSGGCPVNPGIVLLAKDSNTSQRRQSLLQLNVNYFGFLQQLTDCLFFPQPPFHFPRAVRCLSPECHLWVYIMSDASFLSDVTCDSFVPVTLTLTSFASCVERVFSCSNCEKTPTNNFVYGLLWLCPITRLGKKSQVLHHTMWDLSPQADRQFSYFDEHVLCHHTYGSWTCKMP